MSASSHPQTNRFMIAFVIACGVVGASQIGKMPSSLPQLQSFFEISRIEVGIAVSILNLVAALCGLVIGIFVDVAGPRRMIAIGMIATGFASISATFVPAYEWLLLTRIIEGLGFLAVMVSAPTELVKLTNEKQRPFILGIWGTFMPLGTGLTLLVAPALLAFSWFHLWIATGSITLIFGITMLKLMSYGIASRSDKSNISVGDVKHVLRTKPIYLIGLVFGGYSFMYMAILAFTPTLLIENSGLTLVQATSAAILFSFANILGNLIGGDLVKRGYGPPDLMIIAALTMGLFAFVIFWSSNLPLQIAALFFFPFFGGWIPACCFICVPRVAPGADLVGISNGLVLQILNCGMLLSAPAMATVVTLAGTWHTAPYVTFTGAVLCSASAFALKPYLKH